MRRVMSRYAGGRAFTNEPGVSSNVVARDAAWFVYGCDHFLPDFSRALLQNLAQGAEAGPRTRAAVESLSRMEVR